MWQAWTIGILGLWLIAASFLKFGPVGILLDNLIVGIIVGIVGFLVVKIKVSSWQGWTAGILGIWLIVASFIPSLRTYTPNLWNDLITGVLVAIAGFAALGGKKQ